MTGRINAKTASNALNTRLKDDASALKDFGQLISFATVVFSNPAIGVTEFMPAKRFLGIEVSPILRRGI